MPALFYNQTNIRQQSQYAKLQYEQNANFITTLLILPSGSGDDFESGHLKGILVGDRKNRIVAPPHDHTRVRLLRVPEPWCTWGAPRVHPRFSRVTLGKLCWTLGAPR